MRLLPVFLPVMLILVACNTRHVTKTTDHEIKQRDSLVYIDRVTVDTVRIPTERLEIEVPVQVFKRDTVVVYKQGRASTKIIYKNGVVTLNTQCDSLQELVLSRDRQIYKLKQSAEKTSTETKEKITKRVPWYYKAALWVCVGLILYFIIKRIIKFYNPLS